MQSKPLLKSADGRNYLVPFILLTSLFFLWGFAHGLLDVLNKHFQELLHVTRAESGLVQFSVYGGYFLAALPAGWFMHRFGYKKGILTGLLLYAAGAFLFYPAAAVQTFWPFLAALLILAFGLAFLETAANPYVSVIGPPESAERRLNFSQSFNGLGWIIGPLTGGLIIFGLQSSGENAFSSIAWPYVGVGIVVMLIALVFLRTRMPEINETSPEKGTGGHASNDIERDRQKNTVTAAVSLDRKLGADRMEGQAQAALPDQHAVRTGRQESMAAPAVKRDHTVESTRYKELLRHPNFILAVIAQFFYVAAQTGINSFFINYTTETIAGITNTQAALILSFGGMGLFWAGRLSGSFLMRQFRPYRLLFAYASVCIFMMLLVIGGFGWVSVSALFITYFFMSIMFPTIFVLGLKDLGPLTKKGSSFLVMAIVGGALCPMLMGYIADHSSMQWGFLVPLFCFAVVLYYALTIERSGP